MIGWHNTEGMIQAPELDGSESWLDPHWDGKWPHMTVSETTALCILALREMPYADYLRTTHWMAIRYRAMQRARGQCQACGRNATDADHMSYERRGFERPEDVMALCRTCHETKHRSFAARTRQEMSQL